jgi:hypothetical protein
MGATSRIDGLRRGLALVAAALCATTLSGCGVVGGVIESLKHPPKPFAETPAPPAPDYAQSKAWMAFPGRDGIERSVPAGFTAVDEATAPADLFFIHPTTYLKNDRWNAPYDIDAPYNAPVLISQVGAFNGCCRMYAPHYRQSTLGALKSSPPSVELAYADVARAFRYYIEHENHGRPFIIAAHSQGAALAVRLLQEEILGKPIQKQLVAAYVAGSYAPANFGDVGLPACTTPTQTGCIASWNTTQVGKTGAFMVTRNTTYWWQGAYRKSGTLGAVCTNPLTWTPDTKAPASANPGSMTFPGAPFPTSATTLPALIPHLTGAGCKDGLLEVDVRDKPGEGFHDSLTLFFGSYHRSDFGLFYAAIRQNAIDRAKAMSSHP